MDVHETGRLGFRLAMAIDGRVATNGGQNMRLVLMLGVLACATSVSACTTLKQVSVPDPAARPFASVKAGDTVVVNLRSGTSALFVVALVNGEYIQSKDGARYHHAEILSLQRRSFSWPRTLGLAAVIYVGVAAIFTALLAAAFS